MMTYQAKTTNFNPKVFKNKKGHTNAYIYIDKSEKVGLIHTLFAVFLVIIHSFTTWYDFCIITFNSQSTFYSSQVIRLKDSPVQDGADATYTFFVNYLPPRNSPIQRNFLAGILMSKIEELQKETKFDLMVNTSTLAAPATAAANNNTVIVAVLNFTADQVRIFS